MSTENSFEQEAVLIGVVGKKGAGKLDNGQDWAVDRIELHCLTSFPESDTMAVGQTAVVYQVQDWLTHYEPAKKLVGQVVVLVMAMVPAKKLGQLPRIECRGFRAKPGSSKAAQG